MRLSFCCCHSIMRMCVLPLKINMSAAKNIFAQTIAISWCLLHIQRAAADNMAYAVTAMQDPVPILSITQNKTAWGQVFNPTWVQPTAATGYRQGLLVRSQNCSKTPPTCKGTEQRASWLTWAELEDESGNLTHTPQVFLIFFHVDH